MDNEINLIALKVGMAMDESLTQFQKDQKKYMKEMEEHMLELTDVVMQLLVEPPSATDSSKRHSQPSLSAIVEPAYFEASQRTVALSAATLKQWEEDKAQEIMIMCSDKLSLTELYQLQQAAQVELRDRVAQVHN